MLNFQVSTDILHVENQALPSKSSEVHELTTKSIFSKHSTIARLVCRGMLMLMLLIRCHFERSEGSRSNIGETLHAVQNDKPHCSNSLSSYTSQEFHP